MVCLFECILRRAALLYVLRARMSRFAGASMGCMNQSSPLKMIISAIGTVGNGS
jgi:hypothetical protein